MHRGSNGHGLTKFTRPEVRAISGEPVPLGWSEQIRVHSRPPWMKGSSCGRRRAEGDAISKVSLEVRSSDIHALVQPAMRRGTPNLEA